MARNYYAEIDKVISEYENGKSWHTKNIDWAANRIDWCWKWRKILQIGLFNNLRRGATVAHRTLAPVVPVRIGAAQQPVTGH